MTRHNLAVHISWLLTSEVTPPVGVHTASAVSATNPRTITETVYADSEEEEHAEDSTPSQLPGPSPKRRVVQTVNVDFRRPPLPSKITPSLLREPHYTVLDESMGKLSSSSKPARPGLVSQHQLATPASTTGSAGSSLTQGYSAFLRANNGKFNRSHCKRID
jgi:bloom syndrome protein